MKTIIKVVACLLAVIIFLGACQVAFGQPPAPPPPPAPLGGAGPVIIIIGIGIIIIEVGGILYYTHKANQTLELGAQDYCHVKYDTGAMGTTVTCEGTCKSGGSCMLYSRRKGSESRWRPTEKDQVEDTSLEYRCFCHDPNRP